MGNTEEVIRQLVHALQMHLPAQEQEAPLVTVFDAIDEFCLEKEAAGRSARTVDSYRQRLGLFAKEHGYLIVGDVSPALVSRYVAAMQRPGTLYDDHPFRSSEKGKLSKATIGGRIQALKSFFKWCEERGYCETSPARRLKRQSYDPSQESRAMAPETLKKLVIAAREEAERGNPRDLALLLFLADTAARVGEVVSLRLGDLGLEQLEADVDGKTGPRTVYFTPPTAVALRRWLEQRPECRHDFVFCSIADRNFGRPLTSGGLYQALRRLAGKAGVKDKRYNPHSIRHLVGQKFVDEGNLELARRKLGHASVVTTSRHYANQDAQRLKRATKQLSLVSAST